MKTSLPSHIEAARVATGEFASPRGSGCYGMFLIRHKNMWLQCIVSDGRDWKETGLPLPAWEHVSVSRADRCPKWEEMQYVKRVFWEDDEVVLQYHVAEKDHINIRPHCLHLWRPVGADIPLPPQVCV